VTENPGDRAQRLLKVGLELVGVVRDHPRDVIADALGQIPAEDKDALLVVLAALVDTDRSASYLLRWVTFDEHGNYVGPVRRPTGLPGSVLAGHAAFTQAKKLGRPISDELLEAERAYQRSRKRGNRSAA